MGKYQDFKRGVTVNGVIFSLDYDTNGLTSIKVTSESGVSFILNPRFLRNMLSIAKEMYDNAEDFKGVLYSITYRGSDISFGGGIDYEGILLILHIQKVQFTWDNRDGPHFIYIRSWIPEDISILESICSFAIKAREEIASR